MNKDKVGESFNYPNTFLPPLDMPKYTFVIQKAKKGITKGHVHGKVSSISLIQLAENNTQMDIKIKDNKSEKFKYDHIPISTSSPNYSS